MSDFFNEQINIANQQDELQKKILDAQLRYVFNRDEVYSIDHLLNKYTTIQDSDKSFSIRDCFGTQYICVPGILGCNIQASFYVNTPNAHSISWIQFWSYKASKDRMLVMASKIVDAFRNDRFVLINKNAKYYDVLSKNGQLVSAEINTLGEVVHWLKDKDEFPISPLACHSDNQKMTIEAVEEYWNNKVIVIDL